KGAAICEELEKLAKETEFTAGYVRVKTPHIAKEKLYLTSGHLPVLYKESMFPPMELDALKDKPEEREKREVLGEKVESLRKSVLGAAYDLRNETEELKQLISETDSQREDSEPFLFEALRQLWHERTLPPILGSLISEFIHVEEEWLDMQ